jgi:probable F420-dependent oxidoreductase
VTYLPMGFILPNVPDELGAKAVLLERLGYDQLACGEHIAFHGPVPNALIRLSFAAAVTSRIRLLAGIVPAPLYPAVLLAKLATEVDVLSNGRLLLGVGVAGEYPPEFEAVGVPLAERGSRTDEALKVLRHLWTHDQSPFVGQFTQFKDIKILPDTVQQGGPPVWVAGRQPSAVRRAAEFGDAWMPYLYSPAQLAESVTLLRCHAVDIGRDPDLIVSWPSCFINCNENRTAAMDEAVATVGTMYNQPFGELAPKYFITGSPEECAERIIEYRHSGADGMMLFAACSNSRYENQVRVVAEQVRPLVNQHSA